MLSGADAKDGGAVLNRVGRDAPVGELLSDGAEEGLRLWEECLT